jgi:hypothetical protein
MELVRFFLRIFDRIKELCNNLYSLLLSGDVFLDGTSGFNSRTGETKDVIMAASSVLPWIIVEVREMLPIETAKEAMMRALKARAEAMAAMKR